ncbi:MAG TPA: molecular chaperone TorD family protein [Patescibacteria group bacterium]|nr:molecular chaperone TorD family protein [Patescibacteria group bacterium]
METTSEEYLALISNREHLYRFLGRIYKVEADQTLLEQMKGMCFPDECEDEELGEGFRMLSESLRSLGGDPVTDLAVDYARVFLGAGIVGDDAAYPYESVYTSPKRLIMQEARDQVLAAYREKGLNKSEMMDFPEDHIALEFEFMAHLCQETQKAVTAQDWPTAMACFKDQIKFLSQHLWNWIPGFCSDVEKFAGTEFYRAVAKITHGYLRLERTILEEVIAETAGEKALKC